MARVHGTTPGAEALAEEAMNVGDGDNSRRNADGPGAPGGDVGRARRHYQKPAILSREVWESVAGVCTGALAKSTMPPCQGPIAS